MLFSPQFFMNNWIKGMTYKQAVEKAYDQEIQYTQSFSAFIPELASTLTEENLANSVQLVGGTNADLLWTSFPVWE